ncbi:hypothetical protein RFI_29799, partial [Reticulomyxa filosa]
KLILSSCSNNFNKHFPREAKKLRLFLIVYKIFTTIEIFAAITIIPCCPFLIISSSTTLSLGLLYQSHIDNSEMIRFCCARNRDTYPLLGRSTNGLNAWFSSTIALPKKIGKYTAHNHNQQTFDAPHQLKDEKHIIICLIFWERVFAIKSDGHITLLTLHMHLINDNNDSYNNKSVQNEMRKINIQKQNQSIYK